MPPDRAAGLPDANSSFEIRRSKFARAFTLIEVMVVMVLLSVIVLVLMAVFNSTQTAFRASVTQAGVLESGRAAMDLMAEDLRAMSPSSGTNYDTTQAWPFLGAGYGAVNFCNAVLTTNVSPPSPLVQPMVGGSSQRVNVLENFFILSRGSANGVPTWYGVGYAVATNSPSGSLYSLYRFYAQTNTHADPRALFNAYASEINSGQWTNMSHLMDGVVALTVRAYDNNGVWLTNGYANLTNMTVENAWFSPPVYGEVEFALFSNTLPASVQVEMGVLEDRALQRAESIPNSSAQASYLAGCAGQVHVFRQRVSIANVDPSAYQ